MPKQNCDVARRAWNILRLALLWARKGGVFKRRPMTELRLLPKFLKGLGHETTPRGDRIWYGERQLSFDKTPIFPRVNGSSSMRYFHIPCLNPPAVDFDYDFGEADENNDGEYGYDYICGRKSFLIKGGSDSDHHQKEDRSVTTPFHEEEDNIDSRAEEFIAKFYEQIKLQRQISYLQYNDTPNRSTC